MSDEMSPRRPTVSVVIPAWNEGSNIASVLRRLPDNVDQVIVVDGHSVDGTVTAARAARPDVVVVQQARMGKGNALAAGFEVATGDYLVMIDADGSMDPAEIPKFIDALDQGAHYAKGTRFAPDGGSDDISLVREIGNLWLNSVTNALFRTRFTDLCYGYNAFHRDCLDVFALPIADDAGVAAYWGDGFEVETLINVRVAKAKLAITEVPSFESKRLSGESKLRTFRDGGRVFATILRERVTRNQHHGRYVDNSRAAIATLAERRGTQALATDST